MVFVTKTIRQLVWFHVEQYVLIQTNLICV